MKQTKESGIWLPFASYNPLINGYCLPGRMDVHRGLFETMWYELNEWHGRSGDIDLAFQLNQEMLDNLLEYHIWHTEGLMWQSGVQKCVHSLKGLINEAYKAFDSTAKRRWMPDATAYNVIIHGHCRAGNLLTSCARASLSAKVKELGLPLMMLSGSTPSSNPLDDHHPKAEGNKERKHEDRRQYWRPKQESKAGLALPFNPHFAFLRNRAANQRA
ncbi:unnamed protein product [Musa banksii]